MADTRKLELRTTADDKVHATITLADDHVIVDGSSATAARQIIDSYTRAVGGSERDAFNYLFKAGWANGPVALISVGMHNEPA